MTQHPDDVGSISDVTREYLATSKCFFLLLLLFIIHDLRLFSVHTPKCTIFLRLF